MKYNDNIWDPHNIDENYERICGTCDEPFPYCYCSQVDNDRDAESNDKLTGDIE